MTSHNQAYLRHATHYEGIARRASKLYEQGGEATLRGLNLFDSEAAANADKDSAAAKLCSDYADAPLHYLNLRHPNEQISWVETDRRGKGMVLGNIGSTYNRLGEYGRAVEYQEKHLEIARGLGDRLGEGNALGNLGQALAALSEHPSP